jgi:hypothetical protein
VNFYTAEPQYSAPRYSANLDFMRIFSIPSISLIEVRIYWKILVWVFGLQEFDLALCAEIFYLTTLVDLFLSNNSRFLPNISNHRLLFLFYTPTPTRFFTKNYKTFSTSHTNPNLPSLIFRLSFVKSHQLGSFPIYHQLSKHHYSSLSIDANPPQSSSQIKNA